MPIPSMNCCPGMYASVEVQAGEKQRYLTLPTDRRDLQPLRRNRLYCGGKRQRQDGKPSLFARQTFVTVGLSRGDQVAILKGIKEGDLVVTSGQLKLKSGSPVIINNKVQPSNDAAPKPVEQ